MLKDSHDTSTKRSPVNLTIRKDIVDEAKALNLNASRAAEKGLITAIKNAREREWKKENLLGIKAVNKRIAKEGVLLKPDWDNT